MRPFGTRTYYGSGDGSKQTLENTIRAYREAKRRRQRVLLIKQETKRVVARKTKPEPAIEQIEDPDAAEDALEEEGKLWFRFFDAECGMHYYATPTGDEVRWDAPASGWMDAPKVMV